MAQDWRSRPKVDRRSNTGSAFANHHLTPFAPETPLTNSCARRNRTNRRGIIRRKLSYNQIFKLPFALLSFDRTMILKSGFVKVTPRQPEIQIHSEGGRGKKGKIFCAILKAGFVKVSPRQPEIRYPINEYSACN